MQRVLGDPLGNKVRLTEQITPSRRPGQRGHVTLILANKSSHPANEVVIRDEPTPPLTYVPNSLTIAGSRMPDPGGDFPLAQGEAKLGLNLGTVRPNSKVTLGYDVVADAAIESVPSLGPSASFSSREIGMPLKANSSEPLSLEELTSQIGQIPGVARAEPLSFRRSRPRLALRGRDAASRGGPASASTSDIWTTTRPSGSSTAPTKPGAGLLSAEAARLCLSGPVTLSRYACRG